MEEFKCRQISVDIRCGGPEFLDYFGLSSKNDLPEIVFKEKEEDDNSDLYESTYKEG